jgi:Right handed beta helix region
MRRHLAASIAVILALMAWTAPAAHAAAADIGCGAVITQSVTLTHDLVCPGTALTIGSWSSRAHITVDLGGHSVTAPATSATVLVAAFATTLQHGRIGGGRVIEMSRNNVYRNLVFDGGGILLSGDSRSKIIYNRFIHGASINTSQNESDIEHNQFDNGPSDRIAISLFEDYATVVDNIITGYGDGIYIRDVLAGAHVQGNVVEHSGTGIKIGETPFSQVPGVVSGNWVLGNSGDGILLGDGSGIGVPGVSPPGLTASNNIALFNGGDGIHIDPSVPNPPYPSYVSHISVTVTSNVAIGNANYGIESPGTIPPNISVTDGGGNIASFNGKPVQCLDVACAIR